LGKLPKTGSRVVEIKGVILEIGEFLGKMPKTLPLSAWHTTLLVQPSRLAPDSYNRRETSELTRLKFILFS
jgi:hypothetical protein